MTSSPLNPHLLRRWEDGKLISKTLDAPDRWEVHGADAVEVELGDLRLVVIQQPASLSARRVGVGACLWDGALLLAAYLTAQPRHRLVGARCVELGAGVGAVGIALAKLGAHVTLTDIGKVLPLLSENVQANGWAAERRGAFHPDKGWAEVQELEWGCPGAERPIRNLAESRPEWVLAADCCYIDNDGASPSTPAFVATCAALCAGGGRALVSFERRSPEVRRCFLEEARRAFGSVEMVPLARLPLKLEYCDLWELAAPLGGDHLQRACT